MQTESSLDPVEDDQVPAGQLLHEIEEVAAFAVDHVPGTQSGQNNEPEVSNQVPAGQLTHVSLVEAPNAREKVPILHRIH